jgi:hypothetical protein
LEQGPFEENIIKACIRDRLPFPNKIQNAPQLKLGLELYYSAFGDLNSCRQMGYGEGPIPWNAINEYAVLNDFSDEQSEDLVYFVRELDVAYLKHRSDKSNS